MPSPELKITSVAGNVKPNIDARVGGWNIKETQIKSVRPELVEGLAERTDYSRLNPIMVRQGSPEFIEGLTTNGFNLRFPSEPISS